MIIRVSGTDYPMAAINKASLLDLLELKRQTGLSMDDLQKMWASVEELQKDPDGDLLGSEPFLMLMAVLMWLSRRRAGERSLRFEDAADVAMTDIEYVQEDGDDAAEDEAPGPR